MTKAFYTKINHKVINFGLFWFLTINLVNAQYYWPKDKYSNLGINMNSTSFYICSREYPRSEINPVDEIDGPLEYNRYEARFILNDSIYKQNRGLKIASYCSDDVPVYIVDKTSKWIMYNYHSNAKMNLTQEKREDNDLSIALDSLDYFAQMDKEKFKTYLLNDFYGIESGMEIIPLSIYDSVNLETFIFIYNTAQIRTVLFPEFGLKAYCKKSIPISELSSHFLKYKVEISNTKLEVSLVLKEKEKCGIYIVFKNGTSSYSNIDQKSIKFKYNPMDIKSVVLDFNHSECFSIL